MKKKNSILIAVGILLAAIFIYYQLRFNHYKVMSGGMQNTLLKGDVILIDKHFDEVETNQIFVFFKSVNEEEQEVCSRVVGLPGDEIKLENAILYLNNKEEKNEYVLHEYNVVAPIGLNKDTLFKDGIDASLLLILDDFGNYQITLSEQDYNLFRKLKFVQKVEQIIHPTAYQYKRNELFIFPNNGKYNWSKDNFGPITVPQKDVTIKLNKDNLPLYKSIIEIAENSLITISEKGIMLQNKLLDEYTFKQNYYWVMSDNRDNAIDSRYYGFVAADKLIGVYTASLYSDN